MLYWRISALGRCAILIIYQKIDLVKSYLSFSMVFVAHKCSPVIPLWISCKTSWSLFRVITICILSFIPWCFIILFRNLQTQTSPTEPSRFLNTGECCSIPCQACHCPSFFQLIAKHHRLSLLCRGSVTIFAEFRTRTSWQYICILWTGLARCSVYDKPFGLLKFQESF